METWKQFTFIAQPDANNPFEPLAWFPEELTAAGSAFLPHLLSTLEGFALPVTSTGVVVCDMKTAVTWMRTRVIPVCKTYSWLVTALLRINVAHALCQTTNPDRELRQQYFKFIDGHMALLCTFRCMSISGRAPERMVAAAYGDKAAADPQADDSRDPGHDEILRNMYMYSRSHAFPDPTGERWGSSVLPHIKPSGQHAECEDTLPDLTSAFSITDWDREVQSPRIIAHLLTKLTGNTKCSIRGFCHIFQEHCRRNASICSLMRRMVYVSLVGAHRNAQSRPRFAIILSLYSELIAPDMHHANLNFLNTWWEYHPTLIYYCCADIATLMLGHAHVVCDQVYENPVQRNADASNIASMNHFRSLFSKLPTDSDCFYRAMEKHGISVADIIERKTYDKIYQAMESYRWTGELVKHPSPTADSESGYFARLHDSQQTEITDRYTNYKKQMQDHVSIMQKQAPHMKKIRLMRDDMGKTKEPWRRAAFSDLLNAHAESFLWRHARMARETSLYTFTRNVYEYSSQINFHSRPWSFKMKKSQCIETIHGQIGAVHKMLWLRMRDISEQAQAYFRFPNDWKERQERVDVYFDSTTPWNRRSDFPWIRMSEVGISIDTIQDMQACEDLFHRPEPESRIFSRILRIVFRDFAEFITVVMFMNRLFMELQLTEYPLPVEMAFKQIEALRAANGLSNSIGDPLPPHLGLAYYCPVCDTLVGSYTGTHAKTRVYIDPTTKTVCCIHRSGEKNAFVRAVEKQLDALKAGRGDENKNAYLAQNVNRFTLHKMSTPTPMRVIRMIGKLVMHKGAEYTLCMQCGKLAEYDIALIRGDRFVCGMCEEACQEKGVWNPLMQNIVCEQYAAVSRAYEEISTDPDTYLNPTAWPVQFTQQDRQDALIELREMGMPLIARQYREMIKVFQLQQHLAADSQTRRCRWCHDRRWGYVPLKDWATTPFDEKSMMCGDDHTISKTTYVYYINDDISHPSERRPRCFFLCGKHFFGSLRRVYGTSHPVLNLSDFIPRLRKIVYMRKRDKNRVDRDIIIE